MAPITTERGSYFACTEPSGSDLQQGDVLEKSDAMCSLIREVHPYYLNDNYTHFLVITQSCDLVRRPKECKSPYITLAAVKPLSFVLERELRKYQSSELERLAEVCSSKSRPNLQRFLSGLLNNNDSQYFYLHHDPRLGVTQPVCAFLRLSISIKAPVHYESCLRARVLSLDQVFRAKLGWLTGNMYSRVGTPDWTPEYISTDEFGRMVDLHLDQLCNWEDDKRLRVAKRQIKDIDGMGREGLRNKIRDIQIQTGRELVEEALREELSKFDPLPNNSNELATKLVKRLASNPKYSQGLKAQN